VVFNFVLPPEPSKPIRPDAVAFQKIVDGLRQIKADLNLPADPEKSKLQVHPGFSPDPAKLTSKLKDFLKANLSKPHLDGPSQFAAISFMGIPGRFEPWIFFKVLADVKTNTVKRVPVSGLFDGVTAPLGQMISFRGNPEGDITPKPAAATTITGVNTRALFPLITDDSKMKSPLAPTSTDPVLSHLRFQDVMDVVANPQILTTLSTDCVSCHTESTRRALMGHSSSLPALAFVPKVSGVASTVLPKDTWNLRNFGWGFNFQAEPRGFMPTVTQRAANEAAESAAYINAHYPPHP